MNTLPTEDHLLLPFERDRLLHTYREFYKTKRNNFLAMVSHFPSLWQNFQLLDEVWTRANRDLTKLGEQRQGLPSLLFQQAHLKFRIAMELGFSLLLPEAWAILRVGIESTVHAHKIHREAGAADVWSARDEGRTHRAAFNRVFMDNKRGSLFPPLGGLEELYPYWRDYSDWGSHSSVVDMGTRVRQVDSPEDETYPFNCFDGNESRAKGCIYHLLNAGRLMERAFFDIFRQRLELDYILAKQRSDFEKRHSEMAGTLRAKHGAEILSGWRDLD